MDKESSLQKQDTNTLHSVFENVNAPCCSGWKADCICSHEERVLRAYSDGHLFEPMTQEQREWCLDEADRAGEGSYPADEARGYDDAEHASRVLMAWNDYVKSNCVL